MTFAKILDFLRRLKTRSEAPTTEYISNDRESQICHWMLFSVSPFLISRTP